MALIWDNAQMTASLEDLRWRCSRALSWHGNRTAAEMLAEIPQDLGVDRNATGGPVDLLEQQICELLGKPAAVFMPSGTMAQQIAARIHADRRGVRAIAFHPTCHLELHEDMAYQRLHGLFGITIGDPNSLLTIDDLRTVSEPLAAVLFELPQREIGGRLPAWDDLIEQTTFVRDRGVPLHLDGARIWECTPYYGKTLTEIAALFDSVYVSLYKGIGALGGCCLAGDEDLVAQARVWRHRHGGTLFALWPYAASAIAALRARLPKMPAYYEHALAIADALRGVDGVEIVPDPPQTPMMHLLLRTTEDHFIETARGLAEAEDLWTWPGSVASDNPAVRKAELTVGDATMDFKPEEVAGILGQFVVQ